MPGGRLQALGVVTAARRIRAGSAGSSHQIGSRRRVTGCTDREVRPNYMCADCHPPASGRTTTSPQIPATTWTDDDVSCESRHGPGSRTSPGRSRTRLQPGPTCTRLDRSGQAGTDELAQGDGPGPLGDECGYRHRQAFTAACVGGSRCLWRLPLATQDDCEGCRTRRAVARFLCSRLSGTGPLPR